MPRLAAAALLLLLTPALVAAQEAPLARPPDPCPNGYCALQGLGRAVHYDPGRMQRAGVVQQRRGNVTLNWRLPWASLPDCGSLGRRFWARFRADARHGWSAWLEFLQVDCSRPGVDWCKHTACVWVKHRQVPTRAWMEPSYELAARLGLGGRGHFDVEVRW